MYKYLNYIILEHFLNYINWSNWHNVNKMYKNKQNAHYHGSNLVALPPTHHTDAIKCIEPTIPDGCRVQYFLVFSSFCSNGFSYSSNIKWSKIKKIYKAKSSNKIVIIVSVYFIHFFTANAIGIIKRVTHI